MTKQFVAYAFNRHCFRLHNADFDVCRHWRCRLARWLEQNVIIMRGKDEDAIGDDDVNGDKLYPDEFIERVLTEIPWYKNDMHIRSTIIALNFNKVTEETSQMIYDELEKYAKSQADSEAKNG